METITICSGTAQGVAPVIVFRLEDGAQTFYHSTGIEALPHEAERNQVLRDKLEIHKLAMCKAYTLMQLKRMDMNDRIFEMQVGRVLQNRMLQAVGSGREPMYGLYLRYVEEMHKVGAVGESRYTQLQSKARKLWRFLVINGLTGLSAREFDSSLLLEYRQFVYDEYKYVPLYPNLYPSGGGRRPPKKRCKNNTVVSDLLALKAFFSELEDAGEIRRSPFRKLSGEKRRSVMHVEYDEPFYLRADEFRRVLLADVPAELQWAKDMFVLNCALGCRIGDLKKLSMEKVAVSEEGIPYVHYIPSKTSRVSKREVVTPLIRPAYEIILRTRFGFNGHNPNYEKQLYNKALRRLLEFCGIDRPVCLYEPEVGDNVYRPLYEVASSKLARKTHVDMLNKVQINYYAAGLHREGSKAVFRYTSLELVDRFALLNAAFGEEGYRV